jgi:hypothetical protein
MEVSGHLQASVALPVCTQLLRREEIPAPAGNRSHMVLVVGVFLEKLIVTQLVSKCSSSYGIRRSVTVFKKSAPFVPMLSHVPAAHTFQPPFPKIHFNIFLPSTSRSSHDSSVGIALGYGLDDRSSRVRFPAGAGNVSLHHRVQNGSGAHPASYPMGTRGSFPGGKAAGAWSWPLTSIQCRGQRMSGAIPPNPQYAFMAWCSVQAQGQLYLYL